LETRVIVEYIERVKAGDKQGVICIVERFERLLKRCARQLKGYDDGYGDLRFKLIEIILRYLTTMDFVNDGAVISYVAKSLSHEYSRISEKLQATLPTLSFSEYPESQLDEAVWYFDDYSDIHLSALKSALTEKEFWVFYRHYIHGIPISSIALQDGIARQTVNRTKNRALDKVKQLMEISD
jgi:hypothetical protein